MKHITETKNYHFAMRASSHIPESEIIQRARFLLRKVLPGDPEESQLLNDLIHLGHNANLFESSIIEKIEQGLWRHQNITSRSIWRLIGNLKNQKIFKSALNAGIGILIWDKIELMKSGFVEMEESISNQLWKERNRFRTQYSDTITGTIEAIEAFGDYARLTDTLTLLKILETDLSSTLEKVSSSIKNYKDRKDLSSKETAQIFNTNIWGFTLATIHLSIEKLSNKNLIENVTELLTNNMEDDLTEQ